jgi:hypothetical protein
MEKTKFDIWGITLLISLFIALTYAGYLSYKSIDYKILNKLEAIKLELPPEATPSAILSATPSATPTK